MRNEYIEALRKALNIGIDILNDFEEDENAKYDNFIEEVENMQEHLQIAINILEKNK